jgi:restriction endonuclease S subunit
MVEPSVNMFGNIVVGGDILCFTPDKKICPKFICYFLRSTSVRNHMNSCINATTGILHLHEHDYSELLIPSISLQDQQKIAKYLDEKIKYTLSLKENLEKLKLQLVKNIFNKNDDKIKLKYLASIKKGEQVNQENFIEENGYFFANGGKNYSGLYSR